MLKNINLILAGDLCLNDSIDISLSNHSIINNNSGLWLMNLETPVLLRNILPRPKAGPFLRGNLSNLSSIAKSLNQLCFTLANNHVMDYGEIGLKQTMDSCDQLGITTVGGGKSLKEAYSPVILELKEVRVGIIARCETQFGIASPWRAGVAPLDSTIYEVIRKLKTEVDIVIVSIHGAAEMCPWPSPEWQDLLRSFVDAGANIIHGHHAHVPQGYENYNGGLIFYGLGNFLVDPMCWKGKPNTLWSVVGDCDLALDKLSYSIKTIVVEEAKDGISVRLSSDEEFQNHSAYLSKCNQPLKDRVLLTGLWQEAAVRMYNLTYAEYLGFKTRPGIKARLGRLRKKLKGTIEGSSREKLLLPYHLFACESHCDAITTALGVLGGELEDLRTDETHRLADEMMPWSTEGATQ